MLEQLVAESENRTAAQRTRWAMAHCIDQARDDTQFARVVNDLLQNPVEEMCWLHRAIGCEQGCVTRCVTTDMLIGRSHWTSPGHSL